MNALPHYDPQRHAWITTDRPYQAAKPFIPTYVLTLLVVPALEYMSHNELAIRSGVGHRIIFDISHQRTKHTRFATADKIISLGLGRPELWWEIPELRVVYEEVA